MSNTHEKSFDPVLSLYDISKGLRFVCASLENEPNDIIGILSIMRDRLQECATFFDEIYPAQCGNVCPMPPEPECSASSHPTPKRTSAD